MIPTSWWPAAARLAGQRLRQNAAALRALLHAARPPSQQRHDDATMATLLARDRADRELRLREVDAAGFQAAGILTATILRREKCGSDAVSLWLERTDGQPLGFRAGQCVTARVWLPDGPCTRTYSISSAPDGSAPFRISIRRVPEGRLSPWFMDHATAGDVLDVAGPSGHFGLIGLAELPREVWLVGAGSGVTPLRSILDEVLASSRPSTIRWVAQDRSPAAAMFRNEVQTLAGRDERLEASWCWTRGRGSDRRRWTSHADVLAHVAPSPDALVLLCGPDEWMSLVRQALLEQGHPESLVRMESFVRSPPAREATGAVHSVRFARSGVLVEVRDDRTLLDAARNAGLPLPFSCTMGGCGACRQTVTEGQVDMPEPNALSHEEREAGAVLTCIACPRSALVIDA